MEFCMVEKFKGLLKDGKLHSSPQGILISLDDSDDSFDSAAEEDDEDYLNEIFCTHTLASHKSNFHAHSCPPSKIGQILMKEMHEHVKHQVNESAKHAAELVEEEEQERLKAQRQKERKRRKKERKKAEKEASKSCANTDHANEKNGNSHSHTDGNQSSNKNKREKGYNSEDDSIENDENEGFLDVNSAFVTKVVQHKLKNNVNNNASNKRSSLKANSSSPVKESSNGTRIVPIPEKNILLGERLAVAGYQCASKEDYDRAIELFTRALRNVPNDHRYWGNRSFCYFQIGAYQKALEDADCTIQLAPNSPKGHYRRAVALAGLKDFVAAEKSFEKVLELDSECQDALDELLNIRVLRLTEMGFDRKLAYCSLKKYTSLEAAVEALMNNENFDTESDDGNLVYQSEEEIDWENIGLYIENNDNSTYSHLSSDTQNIEYNQSTMQQQLETQIDENDYDGDPSKFSKKQAAMDPSNPNRCVSIWVGSIDESVSEKSLNDEFSRFGEILSIRMLPSSHCAFINFKDSRAPGPAMAAMQGKELCGKKLTIRYPNKTKEEQHIHQQMLCHQKRWQSVLNDSEDSGAFGGSSPSSPSISNTKTTLVPTAKGAKVKLKGPVNGAECYFWRTTGCAFGDNCRNKHIQENRGIDRKPWHK